MRRRPVSAPAGTGVREGHRVDRLDDVEQLDRPCRLVRLELADQVPLHRRQRGDLGRPPPGRGSRPGSSGPAAERRAGRVERRRSSRPPRAGRRAGRARRASAAPRCGWHGRRWRAPAELAADRSGSATGRGRPRQRSRLRRRNAGMSRSSTSCVCGPRDGAAPGGARLAAPAPAWRRGQRPAGCRRGVAARRRSHRDCALRARSAARAGSRGSPGRARRPSGRASAAGDGRACAHESKPVAMTVIATSSPMRSSMTVPKMMFASGSAVSLMISAASSTSNRPRLGAAGDVEQHALGARDVDLEQRAGDRHRGRPRRRGPRRWRGRCPSARSRRPS